MLKTKAIFNRKSHYFDPEECVIEKVITLGSEEYDHFAGHLHQEYDFIRDNIDLMYFDATERVQHCLLVIGESCVNGILVQSDGTEYARNTAFMPHAANLLAIYNSGNLISE